MNGRMEGDCEPEQWLERGETALTKGMAILEERLRCPICRGFLNTVVTLSCPIGHSFCSTCLRGSQQEWPNECPVCKVSKTSGNNGTFNATALRIQPCRALDEAVRGFVAVRQALLELVVKGDKAAAACEQSVDEASLEDLACGSASNAGLDTLSAVPWAANKLSKVNYHLTKDDKIRAQLSAIGMNTHGSREKLVFRHKSVLNAALAELDALKMGRPLRSKEEIFREVDEAERKRDEEMRRKGGAAMSQKNLDKGFKELIARARQAKVQKEGGLPQAPEQAREAGQGEEGEVGKMMSLPRAGDGGPPRPAEETADAAEQSSVCLEDGSSLSDASTVSPPPRAGDRDDLDGEEGGGGQTVVVALDAEESRASADEVQVVGTCPPPTTESAAFTSLSAAQPPPLAPPLQSPPPAALKRASAGPGSMSGGHKRQRSLFEQAGVRAASPISCPICTYRNAGTRKTCEVCGTSFAGGVGKEEVLDAQRRILDSVAHTA